MKVDPSAIPPSIPRGLVRAGPVRITVLFLAIGIAASVPLQLVIAWRGAEPGPAEILLRAILAACSFGIGIVVFLWIVARFGRLPSA